MNKRFLTIAAIGCLMLLAATVSPTAAQMTDVRYVVEDLGTLSADPNRPSSARAINSVGQVSGVATGDLGELRLFRWTNGTMQSLGII
ncbi:MAG: hypothetical protein M3384_09270, partial [Acidobacteriota bacterium]|nr:hypothetical protein [Acidobacteriota bacterium]